MLEKRLNTLQRNLEGVKKKTHPDHSSRDKNIFDMKKRHFLGLMEKKRFKQISKFQAISTERENKQKKRGKIK